MKAAIDQSDRDVHHRIAERPLARRFLGRLAHRRDVLPRHRPADNLVDELETLAALARGNIQLHVGELPVSAGLPLQPPLLVHRPADGFAERDARPMGVHFHAEGVRQPLHRPLQVHLALAGQGGLAHVRVLAQHQPGILLHQLLQRGGKPHVVFAVGGVDGKYIDGLRRRR